VGDTVTVHNVIREGEKSRVQLFKGIILAKKGSGLRETFTIRKISDGIGVEKIFPLHSPNIQKITVDKIGQTRRSKIYYMRERYGRSAMKVNAASPALEKRYAQAAEKRANAQAKAEEAKAKAETAEKAEPTPEAVEATEK
jgi:large subunit ribosomal protein L19